MAPDPAGLIYRMQPGIALLSGGSVPGLMGSDSVMRSICLAGLPAALVANGPAVAAADRPTLQQAIGADSPLRVSGSLRLRYETLDGQARAGLPPTDEQLALRTALAVEYRASHWRIGAELNDSRAWLGVPGSSISANDVDTLEPVQAYVGLDLPGALGKGTVASLLAGRFTWNLGSRRLIASDDYRNATSSYTGVRAELKGRGGGVATLFYVLPVNRYPADQASVLANKVKLNTESFDLRLFGVMLARPAKAGRLGAELGWYRLAERDGPGRATRDRRLHTFSARLWREPAAGRPDFEIEGAWQIGSISTATATGAPMQRVSAGMLHASAGYLFAGPARLRLGLAYDWVSGDRPGGAYNRFDTLFGGRRFEFPPSGVLAAIGRANISSPGVRVEAAPGKRLDAMVFYRAMWLASRSDAFSTTGVVDRSGGSGSFAGHLVDMRLRYWLVPGLLRGEVDYDFIAKGRFLNAAPNAPRTGNTHYLSVGATATF